MKAPTIDVGRLVRDRVTLTVRVKGARALAWRLRFLMLILRLAAWVAPFAVDVRHEDAP